MKGFSIFLMAISFLVFVFTGFGIWGFVMGLNDQIILAPFTFLSGGLLMLLSILAWRDK